MSLQEELISEGCVQTLTNGNRKTVCYVNKSGDIVAKICRKCETLLKIEKFSKDKGCVGGVRGDCKQCRSHYAKRYKKDNRTKLTEYRREYRKANKEKIAAYMKYYQKKNSTKYIAYRKLNKERYILTAQKWQKENSQRHNENTKKWRKANPDKVCISHQKRRALKKSLPCSLTHIQKNEILRYFNGECALTGGTQDIHLDHVIPIRVGHGGTIFQNIIPLSKDMNLSKSSSNIFEWFNANRERFNLEQSRFDALIEYLADINEMTVEEYRDYVYWCHENPREINELEDDSNVAQ